MKTTPPRPTPRRAFRARRVLRSRRAAAAGLTAAAIVTSAAAVYAILPATGHALGATVVPNGGTLTWKNSVASDNGGVALWSNSAVRASVSGAGTLSLVARGDQCQGAPVVSVIVDGRRGADVSLPTTTDTSHVLATGLPSGQHSVHLRFHNDLYGVGCDRNAYLTQLTMTPDEPARATGTPSSAPTPVEASTAASASKPPATTSEPAQTPAPIATSTPTPPVSSSSTEGAAAADSKIWEPMVVENFDRDAGAGSFASIYGGTLNAYGPYPTSSAGWWLPENLSVRDGVLRMHNGWKDGRPTSAGFSVDLPAPASGGHMVYGRSEVRVRTDAPLAKYGAAILWWPREGWPVTGELDFPEGNFDGDVYGYTHLTGQGMDQSSHLAGPIWSQWHTYTTEWTPAGVSYFVDGKLLGRDTARTPTTHFTFAVQTGAYNKAQLPDPSTSGNLLVDYVKVWRYVG